MTDMTDMTGDMGDMRTEVPPSPSTTRKRKGPKPGSVHAGMFKAGEYDPRRHVPSDARVKIRKTVEELCKQHAEDAVAFLAELVTNESASDKERRAASAELLDRAYGRPVDRVAIAQVGNDHSQPSSLPLDQLRYKANQILNDQPVIIEGEE